MLLPPELRRQQTAAVNRLPPPQLADEADGERSGEILIARLEDFARSVSTPLSGWASWVLRHSLEELLEDSREKGYDEEHTRGLFVGLNNRSVDLIRAAITSDKRYEDIFNIKAARGLRVPAFWELHYEVIYSTNLPWIISVVMQNAFLGNPMAGENKPWRSP
ncbi:MAG: hypothetical protein Q7T17_10475 [Microbacterium sp.]|uniref:hypothetical protein n=1 Tax=Microbacterium sp. TaxID=51671 RepID=UPI0027241144|nr:hypothetical protein [Microbacterium sp.]MDO8383390.1 hypothetical protein [Microbacterium sp.]